MSAQPLVTCPNCGNPIDGDSKFCKFCAFDISGSAVTGPAPEPGATASPPKPGAKSRKPVIVAVALVALLLAGVAAAYFAVRGPQPLAASAVAPTPTPAPAVGERARQVEEKILRGEALAEGDLAGLSAYELRVLRNVHFARYGRKYDEGGQLGGYFYTRPWYKPSDTYADSQLTQTDKDNVNLILALEKRAGEAGGTDTAANTNSGGETAVTTASASSAGGGESGSSSSLSNEKVESAVDRALDFIQKGGRVEVIGIQELPQENAARADLQFVNFQYSADMAGTPLKKTKQQPKKPDIHSRSFYEDMYKYGTQQVYTKQYSGRGTAVLKHYNDGRWVLTGVHFNFFSINSTVTIR